MMIGHTAGKIMLEDFRRGEGGELWKMVSNAHPMANDGNEFS